MWLLDTNVLSETARRSPFPGVLAWIRSKDITALYTHSLVMAEIGIGVDRQPNPARRLELARWLDLRLRPLFAGRVIESDEMTWLVLLRMIDRTKAANRTIPVADLIIAAAAERHGLIIVTRNVKDFAGTGVQVLNPWLPSPTPVLA